MNRIRRSLPRTVPTSQVSSSLRRAFDSRVFGTHRWQIEPLPPLIPGPVIVGKVGVTKAGQVEEDDGGGHAAVAVGHGGAVRRDPSVLDAATELFLGQETAP